MMKNDLLYNLQNNMETMDQLHNNLATGKKVRLPHEDVVSATHSMLYRSRIEQINQYLKNIDEGSERLNVADSSLQSLSGILQRFEELAVQGANGLYTNHDRGMIASEIDELLKQMVQISNSKFKGETLFSGHMTDKDPFEVVLGKPSYADREVIMDVRYKGNIGEQNREIEQGEYVAANIPGNKAFWTMNQLVQANKDITAYTAGANSQFKIDGKVIDIAQGDNVDTIIAKINNAHVPVYASRYGYNREFVQITTTSPHEVWMEDIGAGTVLQDIGVSSRVMQPNQAPSGTSRMSLSLFDMAIQLRDDLWKGDIEQIGGRDVAMIQASLDNLMKANAEVGARVNRLETVKSRLTTDQVSMQDILGKTENIDFPETIMQLKMLEYVHQSALASGARILKPTLIDFLR
jgi:flagellar hook-associated protein 3 FlgL